MEARALSICRFNNQVQQKNKTKKDFKTSCVFRQVVILGERIFVSLAHFRIRYSLTSGYLFYVFS
jgi:hypothetical protein